MENDRSDGHPRDSGHPKDYRYTDRSTNRIDMLEVRMAAAETWQAARSVEISALKVSFDKHLDATAEEARRSAGDARATLDTVMAIRGELVELRAARGMIPQETIYRIIAAIAALVTVAGAVVAVATRVAT